MLNPSLRKYVSLYAIALKTFITIISIFLLASCKSKKVSKTNLTIPDKSKIVTVKLLDSLGTVTFAIPNLYDTFFQWTHWSDCGKPCAKEKYRFQMKVFPIIKESGWYWDEPNDSIYRFTIRHTNYFPFYDIKDTSKDMIIMHHNPFKARLSVDPINPPIVFDTIEKINDRYFLIVVMDSINKKTLTHYKKVVGLTTIKGNEIEFHYDLKSKDTTVEVKDFIINSLKYLHTIRLSNGI